MTGQPATPGAAEARAWEEGLAAGQRYERNFQTAAMAVSAGFTPNPPERPVNPYEVPPAVAVVTE